MDCFKSKSPRALSGRHKNIEMSIINLAGLNKIIEISKEKNIDGLEGYNQTLFINAVLEPAIIKALAKYEIK